MSIESNSASDRRLLARAKQENRIWAIFVVISVLILLGYMFWSRYAKAGEPAVLPKATDKCHHQKDKCSHRWKWCWNDYVCYRTFNRCNTELNAQKLLLHEVQ
jgi:hypothetical protein